MKPTILIKKIYCTLILLTSKNANVDGWDRFEYVVKLVLTFAPIAALLSYLGLWYDENKTFFHWVIVCVSANMAVGVVYHLKMKTFSWKAMFKSTIVMISYLLVVYILLEGLRSPLGKEGVMGGFASAFAQTIQLITLLWPVSKALRNIHVLTERKHPPAFIMNRLYNFEKTGDEKALFGKKDDEEDNNNLDNVG